MTTDQRSSLFFFVPFVLFVLKIDNLRLRDRSRTRRLRWASYLSPTYPEPCHHPGHRRTVHGCNATHYFPSFGILHRPTKVRYTFCHACIPEHTDTDEIVKGSPNPRNREATTESTEIRQRITIVGSTNLYKNSPRRARRARRRKEK